MNSSKIFDSIIILKFGKTKVAKTKRILSCNKSNKNLGC